MDGFRVDAKNFSITYPQCPATKEDLLEHLQALSPSYICIGRELHADGNYHLHAALQFKKKKTIRSPRYFDFLCYHPNVQGTRNIGKWIDYVKKGGNFIEIGTITNNIAGSARTSSEINLSEISDANLFNFCLNNKVPFGYYNEERRSRNHVDTTIEESTTNGIMCFMLQTLPFPETNQRSTLLIGGTGLGKTTWAVARAPKPALLVSHIDQLKNFQPNRHKSIIFDDMEFKHWPPGNQIHLLDWDQPRAIHVRYGTVTLPAHTIKVFTANVFPFHSDNQQQMEAITRRLRQINVF